MISNYIPEKDKKEFCDRCFEICSRHCVIYRKALFKCEEEQFAKGEKDNGSRANNESVHTL